MRRSTFVPFLFSLAAFILSILCLFAGSKVGYLENAHLLTLNTSMLEPLTLNTSKFPSLFQNVNGVIEEKVVNDVVEVNEAILDFAKRLGIHEFYSAHILGYCEGFYMPSTLSDKTVPPEKNVTKCSSPVPRFNFDPTRVIMQELKPGINLEDLKWPSAIEDCTNAAKKASKTLFILYCLGITATGLALIGAFAGILMPGRTGPILNIPLSLLAFLCLVAASSLASIIIVTVVKTINKYGDDIGIAAYKGKTFMGMTWAATILSLLASITWCYECIRGRPKSNPPKGS